MSRGVALLGWMVSGSAVAADLHVGPGRPYTTIAAAATAAGSGDIVWIDPGTWNEWLGLGGKPLTLRANGPLGSVVLTSSSAEVLNLNTPDLELVDLVIDGQGIRRGIYAFGGTLDLVGCELRNTSSAWGAAVQMSAGTLTLDHTRILDATSPFGHGGGVYAWGSTVVVRDGRFERNRATGSGIWGGALMSNGNGSLLVERSTFVESGADYGGAIGAYQGSLDVRDSVFEDNSGYDGGAVYCQLTASCAVTDSIFERNTAVHDGGAFHAYASTAATVTRSLFCSNRGNVRGGALQLTWTPGVLQNNAATDNVAGWGGALGVYYYAAATMLNNTLVANTADSAGAVWIEDNATLATINDLIAFHQSGPTNGYTVYDTYAPPTFDHTLFWSNATADHNGTNGAGVVLSDPLLTGWPGGACEWSEVVPMVGSPVVDAGNPGLLDPDSSRSDIGAMGGLYPPFDLAEDADGDGWSAQRDCDDDDATVNPGATEVCDGSVDEDCDGLVDNADPSAAGAVSTWPDLDWDGHGDFDAVPTLACPDETHATTGDDCEPLDPLQWEGPAWYVDNDGDDLGDPDTALNACVAPLGRVPDGTDCDDTDDTVLGPTPWYPDADGDGVGAVPGVAACEAPPGHEADGSDCDDGDPDNFPGNTEICDGADNDCDGSVDQADPDVDLTTQRNWYADLDGDGFGAGAGTFGCTPPPDTTDNDLDCNDTDASIAPDAFETCDGVDEDCDGAIDNDAFDATIWFIDVDGDGWGDPYSATTACQQPPDGIDRGGDCADLDAGVNPGMPETCDGVDEDCDGAIDDDAIDALPWFADGDGDGHGLVDGDTLFTCAAPPGYAAFDDDCNDSVATTFPGAPELCNGADDDCDGDVDEDLPVSPWYPDIDADGFGDAAAPPIVDCGPPAEHVADATDCNDADPDVFPGAAEVPGDGVDDDCDGADLVTDSSRDWEDDGSATSGGDPAATGCGCDSSARGTSAWLPGLALLLAWRRHRGRRTRAGT